MIEEMVCIAIMLCGIVIITLSSIAIIKEGMDIKNMIAKREEDFDIIRQKTYAYDKGYKEGYNKGYDIGYCDGEFYTKEDDDD